LLAGRRLAAAFQPAVEGKASIFKKKPIAKEIRELRPPESLQGVGRATTLHDYHENHASKPRTLLLAGRDGQIHFAGTPARVCLRKHFSAGKEGLLPAELCQWVRRASQEDPPLLRRTEETLLQVKLVQADAHGAVCVLLEETPIRSSSVPAGERSLTAREAEVLSWVRRGKSNLEMALLLNVTVNTVKKHLQNIYVKLGVNNRTAAAGF